MAAPANDPPPPAGQPPRVEIGRLGVGTADNGLASILVPVRYPIELAGRPAETRVRLIDPGHGTVGSWVLHETLSSGRPRRPEKRERFAFVHRIGLDAEQTARLRDGLRVQVVAPGELDVDEDGEAELKSIDKLVRPLSEESGPDSLCSTVPELNVRPGRQVSVPLPVCGDDVSWTLGDRPDDGRAQIRHGHLIYSAPRRFHGSAEMRLVARRGDGSATASSFASSDVVIDIGGADSNVEVRALGDSVTAGFGYYDDGSLMTIGSLLGCRPPATNYNDACSSNSRNRNRTTPGLNYAPDFGLANEISWAAQWANEFGVTNYKNYAVSGSDPADWAPGGQFHGTTEAIEQEGPDYILLTMGANPLLSEVLFGFDNMGCALASHIYGDFSECVERAFERVGLRDNLRSLYGDLFRNTPAKTTVYLMQYPLTVPSTALAYSSTQIARMVQMMNQAIEAVAAEVDPLHGQLQVVAPPHFDVGIDISPVYPSTYSCSRLGYTVDGPSVQSTLTQTQFRLLHPLSFCAGPAQGSPWVISADTGIHPSAAGYAQMALEVPPAAG
jgi:lysophospholipase L1-like esterase